MISAIEYSGNKKISVSQIKDRLKEQKVEVKVGAPLSLRDIAKVRAAIADYYTEQGFRSAAVDFRIEDISKTDKKVIFVDRRGRQDQDRLDSLHRQQGALRADACATR